jgi:hypothetical protein
VIGTLDAIRRDALGVAMRVRPVRAVFVDRARRVQVGAAIGLAVSFVLALRAPLFALWLGAAFLGVPHVVAGVRHVAVKRSVERPTLALVALAALVGIAQIAGFGEAGDVAGRAFVVIFGAAALVELAAARARAVVTAALAAAIVACVAMGVARPTIALLALAHVHAVGSIAYAAVVARRRGVSLAPIVAVAIAVAVVALLGGLDTLYPARLVAPRSAATSIALEAAGASLDGASSIGFRRALFLYAFGQSLHFAMWLRVVPEVDRDSPVPWTFRRALVAMRADFGRFAVPLLAGCAASIPLLVIGGGVARETYFALTYFHFGLEAAALVRLLCRPLAWQKTAQCPPSP